MATTLRGAIDALVVQLNTLAAEIDKNNDIQVGQAIEPQARFFTAVQKRSNELQADVTAAKKRLGPKRLSAWAGAMMTQAAQDIRDGAMGQSDDVRLTIEGAAKTVEGFAQLTTLNTQPEAQE